MVPEKWCATDGWREGQTDEWKKRHREEGASPKHRDKKPIILSYIYTLICTQYVCIHTYTCTSLHVYIPGYLNRSK